MRLSKILGALTLVGAFGLVSASSDARADNEFDVNVKGTTVTVTAKGAWHVNKEYPWKLTAGDKKFDKSKFKLDDHSATLGGLPKGTAKLKGGVCNGGQCKNFTKEITIK